jgi:hypothetical protein
MLVSYKVTAMVRAARLPRTLKRRPQLKAVLFALADRCNNDGLDAFPSTKTIMAETELGEHTVKACLDALQAAGLIHEQEPPRQHRARTWRVNLELLQSVAAPLPDAALDTRVGPQPGADLGEPAPLPGAGLNLESEGVEAPSGPRSVESAPRNGPPGPRFPGSSSAPGGGRSGPFLNGSERSTERSTAAQAPHSPLRGDKREKAFHQARDLATTLVSMPGVDHADMKRELQKVLLARQIPFDDELMDLAIASANRLARVRATA